MENVRNELNKPVKKYMTLAEFEKQETGPVYVLNNTEGHQQGVVTFTVGKSGQLGVDDVVIPSTFIPIDLMDQVSRKQLKDSSEFKKAIRGQIILLLTNEYAEELLDDEDAKEEQKRLFNLSQALDNQIHAESDLVTGAMLHPGLTKINPSSPNNDVEEDVNPKVAAILEKAFEDNDAQGAISSFRRIIKEIDNDDLNYIVKRCHKKMKQLSKWAEKRLEER